MKKYFLSVMLLGLGLQFSNSYAADNRCNDIQLTGDDLWIAVDGSVLKRNLSTGRQTELFNFANHEQSSADAVYNIAAKASDDVWVSCGKAGVAHYDGEKVELSNSVGASASSRCRFVGFDRNGTLWAALGYGGFSKYESGEWHNAYDYRGSDIYSSYYVTGMSFDSGNKMWWSASQPRDGFGYCSPETEWCAISDSDDFYNQYGTHTLNSLAIDTDNNKWLGVKGSSILKYGADESTQLFTLYEVFHDGDNTAPVLDVQIGPDGRVWVANGHSLCAFTCKDDIERIEIPFPEKDVVITCFKHEGDGIWIGTDAHGLFHWQGGRLESVNLSAGVCDITADETVDRETPVYDIMGRTVKRTVPGNLYIRGGHKFIAR